MTEEAHLRSGAHERTLLDAFLYASGELEFARAQQFEERLACDPEACAALAQAVQQAHRIAGMPGCLPEPTYRSAVSRRLGLPAPEPLWLRCWRYLAAPRWQRGHPLLWGGLGAVLVLGILTLHPNDDSSPAPLPPDPSVVEGPTFPVSIPLKEEDQPEEWTGEMAAHWAELHSPEHLEQVQVERRQWQVDQSRRWHRRTHAALTEDLGESGSGRGESDASGH